MNDSSQKTENDARRYRGPDDHPSNAPHLPCPWGDHGGKGVPAHCRCGARWPCDLRFPPDKTRAEGGST